MGEWIEWNGKGRPDIGDAEVELKFRDGLTSEGCTYPANIIGWFHLDDRDDIVAYRIVDTPNA